MATASKKTASAEPPWDKPNPKEKAGAKASTHLSPAAKAAAKRSAGKAGRPYPNLVDNMRAAQVARRGLAATATHTRAPTKVGAAKAKAGKAQ